jgi:hypothetical protein
LNGKKGHDDVKLELKNLLLGRVRLEKTYDIGREMKWGHLDNYKPYVTWEKDGHRVLFEVEYWYFQDKIIEDIICGSILGVDKLVFVFSNKVDSESGWDGRTRVEAAEYLGEIIGQLMSKPLMVRAIIIEKPEDIKQKLEACARVSDLSAKQAQIRRKKTKEDF